MPGDMLLYKDMFISVFIIQVALLLNYQNDRRKE